MKKSQKSARNRQDVSLHSVLCRAVAALAQPRFAAPELPERRGEAEVETAERGWDGWEMEKPWKSLVWLVVWLPSILFSPLISINIGNLIIPIDEVIFFKGVGIQPPTSHEKLRCFPSVSTLRGSYGRCKGRCFIRVLTLVSSFSPVNFGLQWIVWNLEVHFGRTGLHKVWSRRSCHETSYRDL